MKSIHPFPARMAPEIALDSLRQLSKKAIVLDPMTGSGTVLRQAVLNGHRAIGFDMDPLAVMMSKVSTQPINFKLLDKLYNTLITKAQNASRDEIVLPWIDKDKETRNFINYWFALRQKQALRRLAFVLHSDIKIRKNVNESNVLRIALSKLIVTKHRGASLAWDVSHSRPHKVTSTNRFDVWDGYARAYNQLKTILVEQKITGRSEIIMGDARNMKSVRSGSVDAIITSPPYLNAIDYLRGHKLSLVWLGYTIEQIRSIRSECIGTERRTTHIFDKQTLKIIQNIPNLNTLPTRQTKMIERYALDACLLMKEVARVLKPSGKAIFVIGNSCVKDVFIKNSDIFSEAAKLHNLTLSKKPIERELPIGSRYLPLPKDDKNALSRRMKKEVILEFSRV